MNRAAASMDTALAGRKPTEWDSPAMKAKIRRRYRSERIFRGLGITALALAGGFLIFLLTTIFSDGWNSFRQTEIRVPVTFEASILGLDPSQPLDEDAILGADYQGLLINQIERVGPQFGDMLSEGSWVKLRDMLLDDPSLIGQQREVWLIARSSYDMLAKGQIDMASAAGDRAVSDQEIAIYQQAVERDMLRTGLGTAFLTGSDSTVPELAGIWGALKGSILTMLVTLAFAFPVGVLAAIHLEEYATRNRWTDVIEVSINNLAAVPSIIFGLLGLAVFLNVFGMPRSAPVVGGLTLALMTLPVIVIASRSAIKAVPPSIKDAALGVGASRVQVVFHHVLPLALPGILTGTIIGLARALGETAPLLMIGMRAFLMAPGEGFTEPATVLPVQVFIWSDNVARGFVEKTSGAIMVLLLFLMLMNSIAIYLRNKYEVRW